MSEIESVKTGQSKGSSSAAGEPGPSNPPEPMDTEGSKELRSEPVPQTVESDRPRRHPKYAWMKGLEALVLNNADCKIETYPIPACVLNRLTELCAPLNIDVFSYDEDEWEDVKLTPYDCCLLEVLCLRLVQRTLTLHHNMKFTKFPLDPYPGLSLDLLHSEDFFTYTGPVVIVVQGVNNAATGTWDLGHLMKDSMLKAYEEEDPDPPPLARGPRTGSQIEFVKMAHARGFRVAIANLNCLSVDESVPKNCRVDFQYYGLDVDLYPDSPIGGGGTTAPNDQYKAMIYLQRSTGLICSVSTIELEERLGCCWEPLLSRCASSRVCVWVHRRADECFMHPLCPMPEHYRDSRVAVLSPHRPTSSPRQSTAGIPTAPNSESSEPQASTSIGAAEAPVTKEDLQRQWRERAAGFWRMTKEKVAVVAFVDPVNRITSFECSSLGYGLVEGTLASPVFIVGKPSPPPAVVGLREWFKKNCVQVVASTLDVGQLVPIRPFEHCNIPKISGGTMDKDMIHAVAMESVFDFFKSKLRKRRTDSSSSNRME